MSSIFFYLVRKRQPWPVLLRRDGSCNRNIVKTRSPSRPDVKEPTEIQHDNMLTTEFCRIYTDHKEEPNVVQVDVAFLTYVEQCETNANVRLDSITYVTAEALLAHEEARRKQKREIGKNAYKHFKWYIKVLKDELGAVGSGKKFKIVHWLISSRNMRAFLVKSEFFPAISIIISPDTEHWYAAHPTSATAGKAKYGTRARSQVDLSPPTYLRCKEDYCANNCRLCQSQPRNSLCLCAVRKRSQIIHPINEDAEDVV